MACIPVFAGDSASPAAEPLILLAEDEAAPWSCPDGTGFVNEVVLASYKAVGVPVILKVLPYARCKQQVIEGSAAGCFSMARDPSLNQTVIFSVRPVASCSVSLIQKIGRPFVIPNANDRTDRAVIGIVNGYEYPQSFSAFCRTERVITEPARTEVLNFRKLDLGRVDAVLVDHNEIKSLESLCRKAGVSSAVSVNREFGEMNLHIGFSLNHPRGRWAKDLYDRGYEIIRSNGVLKEIESRWSRGTAP
jgi:hypothetical protein